MISPGALAPMMNGYARTCDYFDYDQSQWGLMCHCGGYGDPQSSLNGRDYTWIYFP